MVSARALVVKAYTFVDYATQAYLALVGLLILLFHGATVAHWQWLVSAHIAVAIMIQALIRGSLSHPGAAGLRFLRYFYPVLLYAGLFAETGWLNQMFIKGYLDPTIIHWDQALFGCQPSLVFMQKLPYLVVSEIFYAAYFSYYLMIGGVGIALYLRNRSVFFRFVSVISFVFYSCYLIYIFVPVIGPPVFFRTIDGYSLPLELQQMIARPGYPPAITSGVFYQIMKWIYAVFEAPGAAIPSSHVAVALGTLYFSFRYLRSIRWVHLVLTLLLCLSTVYCRYHYVCDVLAGIAIAALLIPAGEWLYSKFNSAPRPA
jgi:membrane-associated phospholipid phosphatase